MNQKTVSVLESTVADAKDYLSKYFGVNRGYNLMIVKMNLPNDKLGRVHTDEDIPFYRMDVDEGKLMRKLKKGNLEDEFQRVLDMIIGEEIGHLLFYLGHKEMYERVFPENFRSLKFVDEVIGHYSGIVYANRNNPDHLLLKPDSENEKAYDLANKLYLKYNDRKLAELSKVKSLSEFQLLIKNYEM